MYYECITMWYMDDAHLSLRLPADLASTLDRIAELRGVGKSQLVREAVSQYLTGGAARDDAAPLLAADFRKVWDALPHLSVDEATAFETDVQQARAALALPDDPWA